MPFHKKVLQPKLCNPVNRSGIFLANGASCVASQLTNSGAECDWKSNFDSPCAIVEITPMALFCHPASATGRVLCQTNEPPIAIRTSAAAMPQFSNGLDQRRGRVTFTPARMFSRKSAGTATSHNFSVTAVSKAIDSLNQRANTGSRWAWTSASAKSGSLASSPPGRYAFKMNLASRLSM